MKILVVSMVVAFVFQISNYTGADETTDRLFQRWQQSSLWKYVWGKNFNQAEELLRYRTRRYCLLLAVYAYDALNAKVEVPEERVRKALKTLNAALIIFNRSTHYSFTGYNNDIEIEITPTSLNHIRSVCISCMSTNNESKIFNFEYGCLPTYFIPTKDVLETYLSNFPAPHAEDAASYGKSYRFDVMPTEKQQVLANLEKICDLIEDEYSSFMGMSDWTREQLLFDY